MLTYWLFTGSEGLKSQTLNPARGFGFKVQNLGWIVGNDWVTVNLLGTPVVPFFLFCLGGLLIKADYEEKGYSIFFRGLLGNLA